MSQPTGPIDTKRHAQQAHADTDIAAADAETVAEARTIEVETAIAWITLAYAERRLAALDAVRVRLARLVRSSPSAVASGNSRPAQTLAGRQGLAALDDRRDELVSANLDAGLADHVMQHAQWMRSKETLEPLARERVDLETASYSAGRAGLLDVVDANSALASAVLDTLDHEALVAIDGARLTLTYRSEPR